ncbi:hypothetical protein [Congregibacter sp.]|uniref:hypothetical protein n=1 Tax=Congregibacter sp. TaxID=2744308 RepID=UPI003F6B4511
MTALKNSNVLKLLSATIVATTMPLAATAFAEDVAGDEATTYRWKVDMRGKPPYKRERVAMETVDVASMEISEIDMATEVVWEREFSGRPPFKRRLIELPVADAASIELVDEQPRGTSFRGRPPFKRHR